MKQNKENENKRLKAEGKEKERRGSKLQGKNPT
jgi:hypothetical protein